MSRARPSWTLPSLCVCFLASSGALAQDADGDGVLDTADLCPGTADGPDSDNDGTPDGCDCAPDDPDVNRDAADICDGVDNNCDGRVDRNTVLDTPAGGLVSRIGRGLASTKSPRELSALADGTLSVGTGYSGDVYYEEAVDLVTVGDTREVEVLFRRTAQSGDNDVQIGFTDGTRTIGWGVFNSYGVLTGAPPLSYHVAAQTGTLEPTFFSGHSVLNLEDQRFPANHTWTPNQDAYFVTFIVTDLKTTIRARGLNGAEFAAIEFPRSLGLDPEADWSFLLFGNSPNETYLIESVEVRQPVPAPDGAVDEDDDGFSVLCDCDDADPKVRPRQLEVCDGRDSDCRPQLSEDLRGAFGGTGIRLLEEWHEGLATIYPGRPSSVEGPDLLLGSGTEAHALLYRRQLDVSVPTDGSSVEVSIEVDRAPEDDRHLELGLVARTGSGYILSLALPGASGSVTPTAAWGENYGETRGLYGEQAAAGSLPDDGRFLATFSLSTGESSVTVQAHDGSTVEVDYPPAAPTLGGPLDLVLIGREAGGTYRIRSLDVSVAPGDTDEDGICNVLDQCAGYDGVEDLDGDGVPSGCDCDDTKSDIRPGASEVCDGVDQDCDDLGDLEMLGGGVGPELASHISRGEAVGDPAQFTLTMPGVVSTPRDYELGYEKALGVLERDDGTVALKIRVQPGGNKAVALSDGNRVITLDIGGSTVWLGTRSEPYLAPDYGFGCVSPHGPHLSSCTWGAAFDVDNTPDFTGVAELTFAADADGQRMLAEADWTPWYTLFSWTAAQPDGQLAHIPPGAQLDFSQPITMYVYGSEIGTAQISRPLADEDHDLVCDARDQCPGADDRQDADLDNVPDGCDRCLGNDGVYDDDGDGWPSGCDCDDGNAAIHPYAEDVCNGIDDDCDQRIDDDTVYALVGAEMKTRREQGVATGHPSRTFTTDLLGDVTVVRPGSIFGEVYFREALGPLPPGDRSLTLDLDLDTMPGDHDFAVGFSDGATAVLAVLADSGTPGTIATAVQATADSASDVIPDGTWGNIVHIAEGPPYELELFFDEDPRMVVTNSAGATMVARPTEPEAMTAINMDALEILFVGNHASETYRFRRAETRRQLTDSDGDSVCDAVDHCPGGDDFSVDSDGDGIVDTCDVCPFGPDDTDSDEDGVADACDRCEGFPDDVDSDGDGLVDGCDPCPDDYANDNDDDGVCDLSDICFGGDDSIDFDGDGVPDFCDDCPLDELGDSDEDGSCDSADICQGNDRSGDLDGDGYCADIDCDDTRASVRPGVDEICDGFDTDCSGALGPDEFDRDQDGLIDCLQAAPVVDAGPEPEPQPPAVPEPGDGGCSCTTAPSGPRGLGALALVALVAIRRRRR